MFYVAGWGEVLRGAGIRLLTPAQLLIPVVGVGVRVWVGIRVGVVVGVWVWYEDGVGMGTDRSRGCM